MANEIEMRALCAHRTYSLLTISSQLRPQSLVGNGLAHSACDGFAGSSRSGNRNKRIGISVKVPLKKRNRQACSLQWCRYRFCTNIAQSSVTRNATVSSAVSIRATGDKCIRSCVKAPLKRKKSLPTGERQRLFCDFVAVYCGLRSSAIW